MVFLANLTKAHCFDKLYLMAAVKKTAAATQYKNVLVLHFIFIIYFMLLFGTPPRSLAVDYNRPWQGRHGHSILCCPSRDLRLPPSLRDPSVKRGCDWTEVSS